MINTIAVAATENVARNPLFPASYDIIWSAIVFFILLIAFWKIFLPRLQRLLDERSAAIEGTIAQASEAQVKAEALLQQYTAQLADARREASEIRDEARADAQRIVAQAKTDAGIEAARIAQTAETQIAAERQSAVVALRKDVGVLAIDLATGIVGAHLANDTNANALVDRFLADLEAAEAKR